MWFQAHEDNIQHPPRLCIINSRSYFTSNSWWRHKMKTFSASLALCEGNSPVTVEFPSQRPVMRSFDVFFYLRLSKRLTKHSRRRWFETPSRSLWRHFNVHIVEVRARGNVSISYKTSYYGGLKPAILGVKMYIALQFSRRLGSRAAKTHTKFPNTNPGMFSRLCVKIRRHVLCDTEMPVPVMP